MIGIVNEGDAHNVSHQCMFAAKAMYRYQNRVSPSAKAETNRPSSMSIDPQDIKMLLSSLGTKGSMQREPKTSAAF